MLVGTVGIPAASIVRIADESLKIVTQVFTWKKQLLHVPISNVSRARIYAKGIDANCELTLRSTTEQYVFTSREPHKLAEYLQALGVRVDLETLPNAALSRLIGLAEKVWFYVVTAVGLVIGLFLAAVAVAWLISKF
jgi:hypothetical protein